MKESLSKKIALILLKQSRGASEREQKAQRQVKVSAAWLHFIVSRFIIFMVIDVN